LLEAGKGPRSNGEFIVDLSDQLTVRVEATIAEIEERVDEAVILSYHSSTPGVPRKEQMPSA